MSHIEQFFFREPSAEDSIKDVYVCPQCGSTDWKFPQPLMATENMFNLPHQVHLLFECRACGHIGIFFKVAEKDVSKIKRITPSREPRDNAERPPRWLLIIVIVFGFIFTGSVVGTLAGACCCLAFVKWFKMWKK